jgi:hypothetical protein
MIMNPSMAFATATAIIIAFLSTLSLILLVARLIYRYGSLKTALAPEESPAPSATISLCGTITSISRTIFGVAILFGTGEMIVISRSAYFWKPCGDSGGWIYGGRVLNQDSS